MFLSFFSADGFEDCETVIEGIFDQLRDPDSRCSPPHEVRVILDCGSHQSIQRGRPTISAFDITHFRLGIYLSNWCSAALRARDGVIQ